MERGDVADHVIGGQHQQQRIVAASLRCRERGERDRRGGVATDRLEHDGLRRVVDHAQLLGDQEAMRLVADDDRRAGAEPVAAARGGLQHRLLVDQRQQLLRIQLARERPEPGTGAAGEKDWNQHVPRDRAMGKTLIRNDMSAAVRPGAMDLTVALARAARAETAKK